MLSPLDNWADENQQAALEMYHEVQNFGTRQSLSESAVVAGSIPMFTCYLLIGQAVQMYVICSLTTLTSRFTVVRWCRTDSYTRTTRHDVYFVLFSNYTHYWRTHDGCIQNKMFNQWVSCRICLRSSDGTIWTIRRHGIYNQLNSRGDYCRQTIRLRC